MARFLQLSDLHVVPEGARASGVLDTRGLLTNAVDQLTGMRSALNPLDAVLVSGDISDDGSAESYDFARTQLERLGLPIFLVPGNHDAREPMRKAFADITDLPPSGPIDWAAQVGNTQVIGLDTLVEGQGGGRLHEESLAFLTKSLTTARSEPVIVMLHHPPILTGIRFMDAIGLANATALEAALSTQANVTIVAGHVHGVHHGRLGGHPVITVPSICSAFTLDRRARAAAGFMTGPTGCAVIDTGPDGLWSVVPLGPVDGPFPF